MCHWGFGLRCQCSLLATQHCLTQRNSWADQVQKGFGLQQMHGRSVLANRNCWRGSCHRECNQAYGFSSLLAILHCWWWDHGPSLQLVSCHLTLVSEVHLFSNAGMHAWTELLHLGWSTCTQKVPVDFYHFMSWSQRRISGSKCVMRQSWNALQSCNFEDIRWRHFLKFLFCRHCFKL